MFIAVRCPLCLLTVYTVFVDNGPAGFSVKSLADEDLPFYNCPMPLCGYHIPTFHFTNFYHNLTVKHHMEISFSKGFKVSRRTIDTRPFRSPGQVAALAITLDTVEDELQRPPVVAWQAQATGGQPLKEQPPKEQPPKYQPAEEQPLEEQPVEEQPPEEQLVEEQASRNIGHQDSQGGAAMPAVADTVRAP